MATATRAAAAVPTLIPTATESLRVTFRYTDAVVAKNKHESNKWVRPLDLRHIADDSFTGADLVRIFPRLRISLRQTHCYVWAGGTLLRHGIAYCWLPDAFNKTIGRRHALREALHTDVRAFRLDVWRTYESRYL